MKIKIFLGFFILVFSFVQGLAQARVDNDDVVGWSDITIGIPLIEKQENGKKVDKLALNITAALRQGRDLKRPIDERVGAAFTYRLNKYFSVGSGYLYHRFRPTEAERRYEHRVLFFLLGEKIYDKVVFRNRALTTYILVHSRPDTVVYRNRFQVNFPIKKEKKMIVSPFVADEPFYNFRLHKWFRNDLHIGVTRQLSKKLAADFFYVRQDFNVGTLRHTNGVGVSFRYRIDRPIKIN